MFLKLLKYVLKLFKRMIVFFLGFIVLYLITAWICSNITTGIEETEEKKSYKIFVATNGVHTDVILPIAYVNKSFGDLSYKTNPEFVAFGWGDKGFYLNTPTWGDLTFSTAVNAVFLESPTAMHVTEYKSVAKDWKSVNIDALQLQRLEKFIQHSFKKDAHGNYQKIGSYSYGSNDTFYEAKGNYSCIRTCNTWTNEAMKKTGIKTAIWTPFDWGILDHL